ncbi:hypothetical protein ABZ611_29910, partial [Streptomyces sp. NPDC007861]|uniref:hypothetical protein n=1 Tax=Streptomyces sp. NPDC007861 TaxID=3154893 RepID=UPI00340D65CF
MTAEAEVTIRLEGGVGKIVTVEAPGSLLTGGASDAYHPPEFPSSTFLTTGNDFSIISWSLPLTKPPRSISVPKATPTLAGIPIAASAPLTHWAPSTQKVTFPSGGQEAAGGIVPQKLAVPAVGGELIAWGNSDYGGTLPTNTNKDRQFAYAHRGQHAGVAITTQGELIAWGNSDYGGTLPTNTNKDRQFAYAHMGQYAGVAITTQGELIAWGHSSYGG